MSLQEWQKYETQVYECFCGKYPGSVLLFDQKKDGRHSQIPRQIDILSKTRHLDIELIGAFDCKHFNEKVDVGVIDTMVGFMDDIDVYFGGVVTTKGFSVAAQNRAKASKIDLRVISFVSPELFADQLVPSLDFSDPRNSMYISIL